MSYFLKHFLLFFWFWFFFFLWRSICILLYGFGTSHECAPLFFFVRFSSFFLASRECTLWSQLKVQKIFFQDPVKNKAYPFRFEEASANMTFFVFHLRICWWANWEKKKKTRVMAKVMMSKRKKKSVDCNSFLKMLFPRLLAFFSFFHPFIFFLICSFHVPLT